MIPVVNNVLGNRSDVIYPTLLQRNPLFFGVF